MAVAGTALHEAIEAYRTKGVSVALQKLREISQGQPNDERPYRLGAALCGSSGLHGRAVKLLERALVVEPPSAELLLALAEAYLAVGEFEKAERVLHSAISSGGDPIRVHVTKVRFYLAKGMLGQASELISQAITLGVEPAEEKALQDELRWHRLIEPGPRRRGRLRLQSTLSHRSIGNVFVGRTGLDSMECAAALSLVTERDLEVATVGGGKVNESIRLARTTIVPASDEFASINEAILDILAECTKCLGLSWPDKIERPQLVRYNGRAGGHYDWHSDDDICGDTYVRKVSVSLQLSTPDKYEGGSLRFKTIEGSLEALRDFGSYAAFASDIKHRVEPVTDGVRWSAVCWGRYCI